jgi:hypothetical protein
MQVPDAEWEYGSADTDPDSKWFPDPFSDREKVRYSSLGTDPSLGTVPDPGAKKVPVPGPELISK